MFAVFSIEIAIYTILLTIVGVITVRWRASHRGTPATVRHYIMAVAFSLFLAIILALTLTPISVNGQLCDASLYYPRLYAGWSWGQAFEQTRGLGVRRFTTGVFAQLFLNIAMFIPLGLLTAGYLRWGLRASALTGFGLSLFIELSQLSGNWGLAPCPYRTFDVDDLLNNTAGTLIGACLMMLWRYLKRRRRIRQDPVLGRKDGKKQRIK